MRRVFAFLLCLCMVLVMVPTDFAFVASAEVNDALTLDSNGYGYCPVCDAEVLWTGLSGASRIGALADSAQGHYYLSGDVNYAASSYFARLRTGAKACLHLNGHTLSYDGYMNISGAGSTLSIMGNGTVNFNGNASTTGGYWKFGFYIQSSGVLNLLGGTYNLTETALANSGLYSATPTSSANGVPMIYQTSGNINVSDATVNGISHISGGQLNLSKSATVENATLSTGSKLNLAADWTGSAMADFDASLEENLVPEARAAAEGTFTGTLTGPNGVVYTPTDAGRLQASGFNAGLVLDENSQALCPVCNETDRKSVV